MKKPSFGLHVLWKYFMQTVNRTWACKKMRNRFSVTYNNVPITGKLEKKLEFFV